MEMFGYKPLLPTDDESVDVEDDVDGAVTTRFCVVDIGEGVIYMVAMLSVIVVLTPGGGGGGAPFGGGGGSCPSRTASNGGGTILTVAHCCLNQAEVDSKSAA